MADENDVKLRPIDKIIGGVVTTGGLAGLTATVWAFLPLILAAFASTVVIIVAAVAVFALLYVVSDASLRGLVGRMYRMMIARIGLAIVRYDPIGALRDHINQLKQRSQGFLAHRTTLKSIVTDLTKTVNELEKERERFLEEAVTARDMGEERQMAKAAKAASRRKETYDDLNAQLQELVKVESVLGKLAEEAQDVIDDCEDEIGQLDLRDKASSAASGAIRSAMDILGDGDMSDQKRAAVAIVEERVGKRLAEIDMAMDKTTGLIGGIDVKNATVDKKALAAVLEYEKRQAPRTGAPVGVATAAKKTAAASAAQKSKL